MAPPFGWEAMCSHRARRTWAQQLAAAGMPALRLEFPGSGNSSGSPLDPGQLASWVATIHAATAWLRGSAGCQQVAVIGIGIGGLVAASALAEGAAIDDLVLWNVPATGRALLRELKAFSRFESAPIPVAMLAGDPPLEAGSLAVGGYTLSPATVSDIGTLDIAALAPQIPAQTRVLVLARDDLKPDQALVSALSAAAGEVQAEPGPGYGSMATEPAESVAPLATIARVSAWLDEDRRTEPAPPPTGAHTSETLTLDLAGNQVRETPVTLRASTGTRFGILTEPAGPPSDVCVVLLNAGALTHIGPNRMWVEAARRWAARGVSSLRLDLDAIGDAEGLEGRYRDVGAFYTTELVSEVRAALDQLVVRDVAQRFVLLGLCSGAYWAFHAALQDERVVAAYLINPRALLWDQDLASLRDARKLHKLRRISTWRRVIDPRRSTTPAKVIAAAVARSATLRLRAVPVHGRRTAVAAHEPPAVEQQFDRLTVTNTRGLLLFTGDEPLYEELRREGTLDRLTHWPTLELDLLAASPDTHTLRPIWCQQRVHAALDAALTRDAGLTSP